MAKNAYFKGFFGDFDIKKAGSARLGQLTAAY
jgi:hypothetical protein